MVSLSSPLGVSGLNSLSVGQTFPVDVELSGLSAGQTLDSLSVELLFDETLLGASDVAPGAIVPNSADFFGSTAPGRVDGAFFTFPFGGAPISAEGVFFSFDALVLGAGSGAIGFGFVEAIETGSFIPFTPTTGPPLNFSAAGATGVPEPSSLLMLAGLAVCAMLAIFHSRIRQNLGGFRKDPNSGQFGYVRF